MSQRITWRAKPCGWRDRERVVALGDEFGPAGPLLLDALEELAKEQRADGEVRTGLRALARAAFLPRGGEGVQLARDVLAFAVRVGALDDLSVGGEDDMTVTCRVSGFAEDQGKGYESVRKGQQRASDDARDDLGHRPDARDNTSSCPGSGDTVPFCPPTGQDRTVQTTTPMPPNKGAVRFDRKVVPAEVLSTATAILDDFNRQAGTGYGALTGQGQPSEALKRILGALRDHPTLDQAKASRIVTIALGRPFWEGKPQPGVVFGPGVVAKHLEDVSVAPSLSVVDRVARLNAAGEAA